MHTYLFFLTTLNTYLPWILLSEKFSTDILIFSKLWKIYKLSRYNLMLWYGLLISIELKKNVENMEEKILFTIVNRTKIITVWISKWIFHKIIQNYTKKFRIINNIVNQTMIIEHVIIDLLIIQSL